MSSVDVIVPSYNYGHFLRQCLGSVLSQTGVEVRVLVIDDASSDNTPEIAKAITQQDPRVEYRRHRINQGHIATYNEGLDWTAGDYALLLSADDLLTAGSLERVTRVMDANPSVGLACGLQIVFAEAIPPEPDAVPLSWTILPGADFVQNLCNIAHNPVRTPTAVVRNRLLKRLGGYRKDLPHAGDLELWLRIGAQTSVAILDCYQAYKRMHGRNMQLDYVSGRIGDLRDRLAAFEVFFHEHGHPRFVPLRPHVLRKIAAEAAWAANEAFEKGDRLAERELIDFVLENDPEFRKTAQWRRLRLKRCLGPKISSFIQTWRDRLPGRSKKRPLLTSS